MLGFNVKSLISRFSMLLEILEQLTANILISKNHLVEAKRAQQGRAGESGGAAEVRHRGGRGLGEEEVAPLLLSPLLSEAPQGSAGGKEV